MRSIRLLPTLLLLAATALAAATAAPAASATCIPRHDGQDLACVDFVHYATGSCARYFVNPPLPGTSAGGNACQPFPLCNAIFCVRAQAGRDALDQALGP